MKIVYWNCQGKSIEQIWLLSNLQIKLLFSNFEIFSFKCWNIRASKALFNPARFVFVYVKYGVFCRNFSKSINVFFLKSGNIRTSSYTEVGFREAEAAVFTSEAKFNVFWKNVGKDRNNSLYYFSIFCLLCHSRMRVVALSCLLFEIKKKCFKILHN